MKGLETFVDWFAGIGGFRLAGEANGLKCVGACDNDNWARKTYAKNFGHEPQFSDAREVVAKAVPDHDLFCGGFPCPAFSLSGKRKGYQDSRGQLIFDVYRVLEAKQPTYVLLENVVGLLSAPLIDEKGRKATDTTGWVFRTILESLGELGYNVQWQVLHSRHWVPQDRRRVYIVCSSRKVPVPEVLPLFDVAGKVGQDKSGYCGPIGKIHTHQGGRVYGPGSVCPTLTAGDKGPFLDDGRGLSLLEPLEKERLQGFPDNWTEGVSDTQRSRQCGNAITVNAATEVIRRLVECHANGGRRLES
jgi:DNA (cytosine-5)-methyltransferase 1